MVAACVNNECRERTSLFQMDNAFNHSAGKPGQLSLQTRVEQCGARSARSYTAVGSSRYLTHSRAGADPLLKPLARSPKREIRGEVEATREKERFLEPVAFY